MSFKTCFMYEGDKRDTPMSNQRWKEMYHRTIDERLSVRMFFR